MTRFSLNRRLLGARITARVLVLDEGVQVALYGGTRPHIGAVSIVSPAGEVSTRQFPGHKEGVISAAWAGALAQAGFCPAVVSAGIHYEHIGPLEIQAVVTLTEQMLSQVLERLARTWDRRQTEDES